MSKIVKEFKLYVKSNVTLYDSNLQEVRYHDILDDGWVMYRLKGVWNKEVEAYVTRPYYAVKYMEQPFVRYVEKLVCISDMKFSVEEYYRCEGGRVISKLAMWVLDKRFRELCELL